MSLNLIFDSTSEFLSRKFFSRDFRIFINGRNKDLKHSFPDEEAYARLKYIKKIKGRTIVIHSGAPDPSRGLVELEMILTLLRNQGIKNIEVFFTYFPYGQQDKVFLTGELNMARSLLDKLFKYYKISQIYIIDPHFGYRPWLKDYPVKIISAFGLFKEVIKNRYPQALVLAADSGQSKRLGIPGAKKKRLNSFKVEFQFPHKIRRQINGRVVCLVDDLVETGNTLVRLEKICKTLGAKKVLVFATHAVLSKGCQTLKTQSDGFYVTNTIRTNSGRLDISQLIINNI